MNRTRTAVVAAAAGLAGVLAVPSGAQADPTCANVWLVKQDGSRQYLPVLGSSGVCRETGWDQWYTGGTEPTATGLPGQYSGAGAEAKVTFPL